MSTTAPAARRRTLRTAAALGAATLVTGGLAACGSSDAPAGGAPSGSSAGATPTAKETIGGSPAEVLREAVAATNRRSAHIAVRASVTEGGRPTTFTVEGDESPSPAKADLTIEAPGAGAALGSVSLRYLDGKVYAKTDAAPSWYALDVARFTKELGPQGSALTSSTDPAEFVRALEQGGELEDAGTQTIDGTATRHIRGTVTSREIAESSKGSQEELHDSLQQLASSDPALKRTFDAPFTFDFYVQADGAVRRLTAAGTLPGTEGGDERLRAQVDLTRQGEDVDVAAPPAGETQELTPDTIGKLLMAG